MTVVPGSLTVAQGGFDSVQVDNSFATWTIGPFPSGVSFTVRDGALATGSYWEPDLNGVIRIVVAVDAPPDTATIFVSGQDNDGYGTAASFFLEIAPMASPQAR